MDIEVTFLDDGSLAINCGDEHRALALWLEQGWSDAQFQEQLKISRELSVLPITIQGTEFSAYIDPDEVQIYAHIQQEYTGDDESLNLALLDVAAGCGYDDYLRIIDYLARV